MYFNSNTRVDGYSFSTLLRVVKLPLYLLDEDINRCGARVSDMVLT